MVQFSHLAWALDLAGGYFWVSHLFTFSRIRYHVLHVYMHYGWLVGRFYFLKVDQSVHITAQQYRRYT